jgi:phenylalanyl-tRNA synthetase beta chain
VEKAIVEAGGHLLTDCSLFDVYEKAETMGEGRKSLAISLELQDMTRTLTDEVVNSTVQTILKTLKETTGAELR